MDSYSRRHRERSSRKRSRSPRDCGRRHGDDAKRLRSRSPYRHSYNNHAGTKRSPDSVSLPFQAQRLHKRDLDPYRAVFADYLDIQKGRDIVDLSEDEVKGRWKSFLGKWNRGELAEGWYDPETKRKADERSATSPLREPGAAGKAIARQPETDRDGGGAARENADDDEDDGYGPALPDSTHSRHGPSVPNFQDLQLRREQASDDRSAQLANLHSERKHDRQLQKDRIKELAPHAEPGTRERQLEKKRDTAAANRAFRDAKDGGEAEIGDGELLGDGEDEYKREVKAEQRRKNERELRKEEVLRARAAEREERVSEVRRKEERTVEMLREIARERFG